MTFRQFIYLAGLNLLRFTWWLKGSRKIIVFGHDLRMTHDTIFPSYRRLMLPKGDCFSEIVKYADFVQSHVVCNFVSGLKNRPTIIDIGAHHGAYAIMVGQIVRQFNGRVIAVEPNSESFEVLKKNVQLNSLETIVKCEQVAVSEQEGIGNISSDGTQSHITSQADVGTAVKVTTLKQLCLQHDVESVDLLLVDVEGAELHVLRSLPWESVKVNRIICELHPYAWQDFGYTGNDFKLFLIEHNYCCIDMYFKEHIEFDEESYIGPTLFVPMCPTNGA